MTELAHWMLLGLMELPEFELWEFQKEPASTHLKIYLNGRVFNIYIDDLTNQVRAAQETIKSN